MTVDALASEWVVFPNPVHTGAAIEIKTAGTDAYIFRIFSLEGKTLAEKQLQGEGHLEGLHF